MRPKIDVAACRSALGNGQCSADRYLYFTKWRPGGRIPHSLLIPNTQHARTHSQNIHVLQSHVRAPFYDVAARDTEYEYTYLRTINIDVKTLQPNIFNRLRAFHTFIRLMLGLPFFYNVRTLNVNHHLQKLYPLSRHINWPYNIFWQLANMKAYFIYTYISVY